MSLPPTGLEKTEVLYGDDNTTRAILQALSESKNKCDTCADSISPSVSIQFFKKVIADATWKGMSFRYLTEVTKDNIPYCKELMELAEVRHLDKIKGNFSIFDDRIYLANAVLKEDQPVPQLIYSNVRTIVEQQEYLFETLWERAIPGEKRIREIEEGIERDETIALENSIEIAKRIKKSIESSNEIKICSQAGGLELIYNNFLESYKKVLDSYRNGQHKGIRYITTINKDNEELATLLLNEGVQLRHTKNLTPLSFSISNKEFQATAEKMEGGKMIKSLLVSTEPIYIDHYDSIFEQLWNNAIDAKDRIIDIKEGVDLTDIEVIPRSARARLLYLELVKNANEEILFIFPTSDAFIRQDKMGAIPLAIEAAKERAVKVRILVPYNKAVGDRLEFRVEEELSRPVYNADIDARFIEQTSGSMATILVVDRKASLVMELRDDSKTTFDEAIGLSTYSNSKAGVLSYVAIFEKLWNQIELYQQVREANERLKLHDKMQQEFINVAAHELRTPIQPILSTVGLLSSANQTMITREELNDSISMIARNATRLKQLSEDILDVTKIESQSLNLRKEVCDLNDMVRNSVEEYKRNQVMRTKKDIEIKYAPYDDKVFVEVDRGRIAQVIFNLLSNAVKFTREGAIVVNIICNQKNNKEATVSVKDSGKGIDPEVVPRLFEKFASKSFQGTGLGLFISRSIVEVHGGRIWAVNNNKVVDGQRGSTFYFTLPIIRSRPNQHN
ncbi:MAG: ATP-binding protein [Thermoproteota archaeon]|nr:ATP-binding protein [Thermoproteota archaeon]